ncbi:unnamed protein product [Brugia timori]|uniref:G_PROTEIN_RECEP_F1_2 domain-containing protein n=1 Tax=Brugia timori TaxID=42155 RepID=A0A0R3QKK9_9BILA|nr:unnamed protein product [Brugia timori]
MIYRLSNNESRIFRTWERRRDDIVVVTIWLIMLSYALASNILILIGIARNNSMRCSTRYFFGAIAVPNHCFAINLLYQF